MDIPLPLAGWKPSTPSVCANSISELLTAHAAVAIHFWAEWDAHDRLVDQCIQQIAPHFRGQIYFCSCNIDLEENHDLAIKCRFANIPAIVVFVHGRPSRPIIGLRTPEKLIEELTTCLTFVEPPSKWWQFWKRIVQKS